MDERMKQGIDGTFGLEYGPECDVDSDSIEYMKKSYSRQRDVFAAKSNREGEGKERCEVPERSLIPCVPLTIIS
jgi:hypothetical protein